MAAGTTALRACGLNITAAITRPICSILTATRSSSCRVHTDLHEPSGLISIASPSVPTTKKTIAAARSRAADVRTDLSATPLRKGLSVLFALMIVAGIVWRIYASIVHADFTGNDQRFYSTIGINIADHLKYNVTGSINVLHWAPGTPTA